MLEEEIKKKNAPQEEAVREAVLKHFGEQGKMMVRIAFCESGLRQFDNKGNVIQNPVTPDRGVFQINVPVWGKEAKKLDLNIDTLEGNILMADHILHTQGIQAWKPSAKCHGYW